VSIFLVLFATTTIAYNCYLGENSIAYFANRPAWAIPAFQHFGTDDDRLGVGSGFGHGLQLLGSDDGAAGDYQLVGAVVSRADRYEVAERLRGAAQRVVLLPVFKRETLPEEKIDEAKLVLTSL
jgi:hypothetical protein